MHHFSRAASWLFGARARRPVALRDRARPSPASSSTSPSRALTSWAATSSPSAPSLAFTVALVERAHVRIDVVHGRLPANRPRRARLAVGRLAAASSAASSSTSATTSSATRSPTGRTAQSPWATPLIYPQSGWYAGLCAVRRRRRRPRPLRHVPPPARTPRRAQRSIRPDGRRGRGARGTRATWRPADGAGTHHSGTCSDERERRHHRLHAPCSG